MLIMTSKCDILSINVDWFDKNPINMAGDKKGFGLDLGKPILIKPLDRSLPVNHEILAQNSHSLVSDNSPHDFEAALLSISLDVRLDTDA